MLILHSLVVGGVQEVLRLKAGQCFGERALLAPAKRAATVQAVGRVVVLGLSRGNMERVLGLPLQVREV